jgi:5-bromo-4-chloroindolyl phosphate hydrolysis protein.
MASILVFSLTWFISFVSFDKGFFLSTLNAFLGGAVTYFGIKSYMNYRYLKMNGLTRREYKLVQKSLKEAKVKIQRLQRALFKPHNLIHAKQSFETLKVAKKIYSITKNEPGRFFKAEEFYFDHLDSLVELSEKYAFLAAQPAKTRELERSLDETWKTITRMTDTIKDDLYNMLEGDIDTLHFELDVAKRSIVRKKNSPRGRFPK